MKNAVCMKGKRENEWNFKLLETGLTIKTAMRYSLRDNIKVP
jgi:hypothetical protein